MNRCSLGSYDAPQKLIPPGGSRRRNAVAIEGDRHERSAELHVVVVHHVLAVRLMLRLAFVEIVARDRVLGQRLGLHRERLRRRRVLVRQFALRHRALFDVEDRLAGDAVEREHQAGLVDDDDCGNGRTVPLQIDEQRRRLRVVVPDVVMNELKVPQVLAGVRVHRDHRRGEEVVAGTIDADAIVVRRAERHVENAAFRVERRVAPDVDARSIFRAALLPGVVAELARPRHGVEGPHQFAGPRVERARVSRGSRAGIRTARPFTHACTDDDEVLVDARRRQERVVHGHAGLHDFGCLERNRRRSHRSRRWACRRTP